MSDPTPRPQTPAEFEALRAQLLDAIRAMRLTEAETIARQLSPVPVAAEVLDAGADRIVVLEFPESSRPSDVLELCTLLAAHTPAQIIAVNSGGGAKVLSIARVNDPVAIDLLETIITSLERSDDPELQGMAAAVRVDAHSAGLPIAPPDDEDDESPQTVLPFPRKVEHLTLVHDADADADADGGGEVTAPRKAGHLTLVHDIDSISISEAPPDSLERWTTALSHDPALCDLPDFPPAGDPDSCDP